MEQRISSCEEMLAQVLGKRPPFKGELKYEKVLLTLQKRHGGVNISCVDCSHVGKNVRGFLEVDPLSVRLCANYIQPSQVTSVLDHELTHAYDFALKRYDMTTERGLAASEIRAARESECAGWFLHDFFKTSCIKDQATASTKSIFPRISSQLIEEEFEGAMKDLEPFGPKTANKDL